MQEQGYYDFSNEMFKGTNNRLKATKLKDGITKLRILPPYAPNKLFIKVELHWGYSDRDGKRFPVKCLGNQSCPICIEHIRLKSLSDEMMSRCNGDPIKLAEAKECEKLSYSVKKKPTYIYQVLDFQGEHKQLSISYRPFNSIYEKIKFYWTEKNINICDPTKSMMLYISRTGKNQQTHYQVEVLEDTIKKIDMPKLVNLEEIHDNQTIEVLAEIVKTGFLPSHSSSSPVGGSNHSPEMSNFSSMGGSAQEMPEYLKEDIPIQNNPDNFGASSQSTEKSGADEVNTSLNNSAPDSFSNGEETFNSFSTSNVNF